MRYATISLLIIFCTFSHTAFSWGKIGHRVVGQIAEAHLTSKARKAIDQILMNEDLALSGTFMDFIRSDRAYDHMVPWHYCTVPDGQTYADVGAPEQGDALVAIERLVGELKSKKFTEEDEAFNLKLLVHLVADIHQPLHVGNGEDRGGNDVKVKFFGKDNNLHRVWDSGIIDEEQLSYTEYARAINHPTPAEIDSWQNSQAIDWVSESQSHREQVYDFEGDISWGYVYRNLELLNTRLLQAGVRLAGLLNEIYG